MINFIPSGSATSCVLKLSNVESGMRGRDGFDIQLGEYDVILRNNEAGKVKLINKYQKGLTINLDNSIETNSNKFLINLNNNNSFTIESNSSFILLNSNIYNGDNILSISDGTDYQYLNTGNLKVFSVGANNDLLSLNNSTGKTLTLNYNTDGYLIFNMINGTHTK